MRNRIDWVGNSCDMISSMIIVKEENSIVVLFDEVMKEFNSKIKKN